MVEIMQNKMNESQSSGGKRRVKIRNYKTDQNEEGLIRFEESQGQDSYFDLIDKMIDVDCDVDVVDKRSKIANDADQLGRIMQAIPTIANIAQVDPSVMNIVDFSGIVVQLIEYLGMDTTKVLKSGSAKYTEKMQMAQEELLLGNEVPIDPSEPRDVSLARFQYISEFKKRVKKLSGGKLAPRVERAINKHLTDTMMNIASNKYIQQSREQMEDQQAMQQPMSQGGEQDVTGGKGSVNLPKDAVKVQQPDSSLLNTSTVAPNK